MTEYRSSNPSNPHPRKKNKKKRPNHYFMRLFRSSFLQSHFYTSKQKFLFMIHTYIYIHTSVYYLSLTMHGVVHTDEVEAICRLLVVGMPTVEQHGNMMVPVQKNQRLFSENHEYRVAQLRNLPKKQPRRTDKRPRAGGRGGGNGEGGISNHDPTVPVLKLCS